MKIFQHLKSQRGAFLLEALLAVMILSVGLVGLIRGLLSSLKAAKESELYSRSILAADNALLNVIRLNGQKSVAVIDLSSDNKNFSTLVMMRSSSNLQIPAILREAQINIKWPGPMKDKEINAATLIFGSADEKP